MPVKSLSFFANLSEVSGPVAIIVIELFVGISNFSSRCISISGWFDNFLVSDLLNFDLSTANAPPAGTEKLSAVLIINDLNILNSAWSKPAALSGLNAPKLLLQTNSFRMMRRRG